MWWSTSLAAPRQVWQRSENCGATTGPLLVGDDNLKWHNKDFNNCKAQIAPAEYPLQCRWTVAAGWLVAPGRRWCHRWHGTFLFSCALFWNTGTGDPGSEAETAVDFCSVCDPNEVLPQLEWYWYAERWMAQGAEGATDETVMCSRHLSWSGRFGWIALSFSFYRSEWIHCFHYGECVFVVFVLLYSCRAGILKIKWPNTRGHFLGTRSVGSLIKVFLNNFEIRILVCF